MTSLQRQPVEQLDFERVRQAVLRFQPASNWVSVARDPTPRMTVGLGFDVSRAEAPEMLRQVGLDPAHVRSGRAPVTDAQMHELFDLTLRAAADWADQRIPRFTELVPERQAALLELILWLGPLNADSVFGELEQLALPLTDEPLEPSPWFDLPPDRDRSGPQDRKPPTPDATYEATFESFGVIGQLACDDPDLLVAAQTMLPPGWRAADRAPSVRFTLPTDGLNIVDVEGADRNRRRESLLLKLASLVRHHIAITAPRLTFVHAGVVEVGGCGIVIPGPSHTGKSVLVAELVHLGATYVSDEYAVIDRSGRLVPFAKPLSIRTGPQDPLGRLVEVPQERVAHHRVQAGLIVVTTYAAGARWQPSVRSSGEGALALLQNTVSARRKPGPAMRATGRVARDAVTLVGRRGEASETAQAVLETALLLSANMNTVRP